MVKPLALLVGAILRRQHHLRPQGTILVLKFQGGGSLVLAAPSLFGVRAANPDCRMVLLTTTGLQPFARSLNLFDDVIALDDSKFVTLVMNFIVAFRKILFVDTVVDLEVYSRLTGVIALATCARNRIGYFLDSTFWRRGLYTHLVFFNRYAPVSFFYERLALLLSGVPWPRIHVASVIQSQLSECRIDELDCPYIAVGVGCSDLSFERRLSEEGWAHFLALHLSGKNTPIVFLGSAADADFVDQVLQKVKEVLPTNRCVSLAGCLSLLDSLYILGGAEHYLGIDSALLHYARLFGIPSTSFWGPVSPTQMLAPWDDIEEETHYTRMPCSPCIHVTSTPPCRGDNICMKSLAGIGQVPVLPTWIEDAESWNIA